MRRDRGEWGLGLLLAAGPGLLQAQQASIGLRLEGRTALVEAVSDRGYAAAPLASLEGLGGTLVVEGDHWRLRLDTTEVVIAAGNPFVRAGGRLLQLADPPYLEGSILNVPLQLLLDVLPAVLPERYDLLARAGEDAPSSPVPPDVTLDVSGELRRVVIIDPGHGGRDPGAMGTQGAREKDIALALARALMAELADHPQLEVHLTRNQDVLIPLWQRGELATQLKGERAGIFISLHANALPRQRATRGFETYFLSPARTDHERRVAANENAPLALDALGDSGDGREADLDFILRELRNLDHQHWSALLAELVQRELDPVHPGPDRGVKQGPFAVITNALMPAVLVEVGFITHREEERLLVERDFQSDAARALASAVVAFFERYPPGPSASAGGIR